MNGRSGIGASIRMTGVFDLALSEVIVRLLETGDEVVDVGANIGYVSALASRCVGQQGKVVSFEPNSSLLPQLRWNVDSRLNNVSVDDIALGATEGLIELMLPPELEQNEGLAHIRRSEADVGDAQTVRMRTYDDAIGLRRVKLLKIDVEGYELQVLRGALRAIASRAITNILFEDHRGDGGEAAVFLAERGYTLFSIGWTITGLAIQPISGGRLAAAYEAPNYLATLAPAEALSRCKPRGWRSLRVVPIA